MCDFIIAYNLPNKNPTDNAKNPTGRTRIPAKKTIAISHAIHKQIIIIIIVAICFPDSPSQMKESSKASPEST